MWKAAAVAYFHVLSQHLSGGRKVNHEQPQSEQSVFQTRHLLKTIQKCKLLSQITQEYNRVFRSLFSDMLCTRKQTEELHMLCVCMCMRACMCHQNLATQRTIVMINKGLKFDGNTLHSLGRQVAPIFKLMPHTAIGNKLRSIGAVKVTKEWKSEWAFNVWEHANILGLFVII